MLGRLLSSAISPSPTANTPSNNQDQNDAYTRGLLYPDIGNFSTIPLYPPENRAGNLELDNGHNVRIIVAQDAGANDQKVVIYDSDAANYIDKIRAKKHASDAYPNGALSPGLKGRRRSAVINSSTFGGAAEDEIRVLTECMFGSAVLAYKGPSIKFHILPNLPTSTTRPSIPLRRSSIKSQSISKLDHIPAGKLIASQDRNLKSVLITRTFSVLVPADQSSEAVQQSIPKANGNSKATNATSIVPPMPIKSTSTITNQLGQNKGYPFPTTNKPGARYTRPQKSMNCAVAMVITIPSTNVTPLAQPINSKRSTVASIDLQNVSQSPPRGREDSTEGLVDDRMDLITKNWDVITRALGEIQAILVKQISETLNKQISLSSHIAHNHHAHKVVLLAGALMNNKVIAMEIERMKWRVIAGFRIPRVMTGQGRWGVWSDEAKWAGEHFGGRDNHL